MRGGKEEGDIGCRYAVKQGVFHPYFRFALNHEIARQRGVPPIRNLGGTLALSRKWVEHRYVMRFSTENRGFSTQKPTSIEGGEGVGSERSEREGIFSGAKRGAASRGDNQ
ncbi:hypothetical protein SAMN04487948_13021 [Halogranum amylolyticum]|uniref:Uncharacterized protein n=1 Tax=Halogranum amylolyticum TaxID=660520 RepID=A0A1H8WHX1_9EURY|nr:hypothetical protein SAMN04487948_13021 [Halogranum amylolyticum]